MTHHKLEQQPFVLSSDLPLHPPIDDRCPSASTRVDFKAASPLLQQVAFLFHINFTVTISKEWDPPARGPRFHYHTVCSLVTQRQQSQEDEICTALEGNCWTFLSDHVLSVSVLTCHLTTQACATTSNLKPRLSNCFKCETHRKNTIKNCVSSQSQQTVACK